MIDLRRSGPGGPPHSRPLVVAWMNFGSWGRSEDVPLGNSVTLVQRSAAQIPSNPPRGQAITFLPGLGEHRHQPVLNMEF